MNILQGCAKRTPYFYYIGEKQMFTLECHADVSKIMAGLGQVGITAAEAGDAMCKMARLLNKDNNTWTYIADSID